MCLTSTDYVPLLVGIQPAEICQERATLSLQSVIDPDHLSHQLMVRPTPAQGEGLRSLHLFCAAAPKLLSELRN